MYSCEMGNNNNRAHGELNGQRKGKIRSKDMNIVDGPSKLRIWVRGNKYTLLTLEDVTQLSYTKLQFDCCMRFYHKLNLVLNHGVCGLLENLKVGNLIGYV